MRLRKLDPSVRKHVYIPESITNEIEVLLCDPISGEVRYGSWSDLVTKLLKEWLEKQRKQPNRVPDRLVS